ncbi:histone-lysine N-methyltransferase SETMAR-like [Lingula anatina]|uniref:Histone-lysine N-methyltransferase SETMAR-like n=1 Tax=Lingula anatina TaxID=7574 RepID=A0A1S3I1J0_LINAN|nr:histone-lysine N-methyltransferase SETMAR-like [Lingula anatina]|eukprot:XP_013392113.1 histone-lysine N-methyltransferase SETMAR-like [Lingula anatina]
MDVSGGCENIPIYLDKRDRKERSPVFQYTKCNIPGPGTDTEDFLSQFQGCDCRSVCLPDTCPCIQRFGPSYNNEGQLICTAISLCDKPVYECNRECKCSIQCSNRIVQRGVQFKLQVRNTDSDKGFGLYALETIPKDHFVCEYAGEVLTQEEAKRRTKALKHTDMNYIFVLREHIHLAQAELSNAPPKDDKHVASTEYRHEPANGNIHVALNKDMHVTPNENIHVHLAVNEDIQLAPNEVLTTYIDPTKIGNVGRFINHSCGPNLYIVPVRVDNSVPKLALFASRDIFAGEELSFNYSGSSGPKPKSTENDCVLSLRKLCHCGYADCQGFLPFDESLFDA